MAAAVNKTMPPPAQAQSAIADLPSPPSEDYIARLISALRSLGPGCRKALGGTATIERRVLEIRGDITIVSEEDPTAMARPIPHGPVAGYWFRKPWTFQDYWNDKAAKSFSPPAATTISFNDWHGWIDAQSYNSIILGPAFSNPAVYDGKTCDYIKANVVGDIATVYDNTLLVHEYLHILNNADDVQLAKILRLDAVGYDIHNQMFASSAISRYLINDCGPERF
ncbi:MAG TPA: hypothetical protein VI756_06160 [Blastocatellia bacterium]